MDLLALLTSLVESSLFVPICCSLLVVGALIVYLYARRKFGDRVKRDVRSLLTLLDGPMETLSERVSILAMSPVARHLRTETSDLYTLGSRRYRICQPYAERFEDLVQKYIDVRSLDALPNVFVGFGLLLTFFCLAVALGNASQGAASGDIAQVKQSVTGLLKVSAAKFSMSLVALFCSIVLGFVLRWQRTSMERLLRTLDDKLDSIFPRLTLETVAAYEHSEAYRTDPERVFSERSLASTVFQTFADAPAVQGLVQTIEELRDRCAGTEQELQSFNSDLAIQLGKALDDKLQPMLTGLAERLETALREMGQEVGGSLGDTNQQALRSTLDTFIAELREATRNDSAELQEKMQQLADGLGKASGELAERMSGVFTGMEATGERFSMALHEASAAFRQEMGRVQEESGSGLTQALEALAASAERSTRDSETMVEKLAAGATSFQGSIADGATSFVSELDRGTRSIDTMIERLGASVTELGEIIDRAATLSAVSSQRAEERVEQLRATLGEIDTSFKSVSEASKPFAQAADQVRSAIDLLRVTQSGVQAKVAALQGAAETISTTSKNFSEAIGHDITRMTDGLDERTERLTTALEKIARESEYLGNRFDTSITKTLEEYERRFAGIDRELGQALEKTIGTFTTTYAEIRERVQQLDEQMSTAVKGLCQANEEFGEHVGDLTEALGRVKPLAVV